MTETLAASPIARAVGLALVQFVWQGAAIGAVTALVLLVLRRSTAQWRYVVACVGLAAMVAAPLVTAVRERRDGRHAPIPGATAPAIAGETAAVRSTPANIAISRTFEVRPAGLAREWLEARLPFVVLIWSAGVFVLALQLLRSWMRIGRIHRSATPLPISRWPEALRVMAGRLGVTRRLRLIESALVDVPAVIGWLRPAIVVPASALAGLTPAHLDAILAHELAHVRRGDYLINVVQSVVEVLLFYHPAVWWVSRQIRIEREHCCDDVAAALCADEVVYAHALASLEELRAQAPALAMAASGGDLVHRIRRLVEPGSASGPRLSGRFAMCVALTILLLAVSSHMQGQPAGNDQPLPSVVAPVVDRVPTPLAPVEPRRANTRAATAVPSAPLPPIAQVVAPAGRGAISGTVIDQQGGALPGVTVTVTSPPTPLARTVTTNAAGRFVIADLASGDYELTVSMPSFKTSRTRFQIAPDETLPVSIRLQIGGLSEAIMVRAPGSANAPPVSQAPPDPRAAEYFDAAKAYYMQGRLSEAEAMTTRALALLRAEIPATPTAAGPPPSPGAPVRVGGDIREPRKIRDVKPAYPADALAAHAEGVVILEATITKTGAVGDARILRSVPMLDDAALDAVRQWLFTPTLLNGQAVEVVMTVTVTFAAR